MNILGVPGCSNINVRGSTINNVRWNISDMNSSGNIIVLKILRRVCSHKSRIGATDGMINR